MMVFRSAISIRLVPRRVSIRLLMPVSQLFDGWQAERILEIAVGENPSPTGSSPTGDPLNPNAAVSWNDPAMAKHRKTTRCRADGKGASRRDGLCRRQVGRPFSS
jgi:hypothetical protein